MVSNEEIRRRLQAKRNGIPLKNEENLNVAKKMNPCPECGTENYKEAKFCVGCGKSFKETEVHIKPKDIKSEVRTKVCPACNSEIPENAKFCVACGETLTNTETNKTEPIKEEIGPLGESKEIIEPLKEDEDQPTKLVVQELILDPEGLVLNKNAVIEGWDSQIGVVKYKDIENISFEESSELGTIEITGKNTNIKIKNIDSDLGNQFTAITQEKILQIKSEAEKAAESMDKIKNAEELLNIGAITEEEFENIKKKILSS